MIFGSKAPTQELGPLRAQWSHMDSHGPGMPEEWTPIVVHTGPNLLPVLAGILNGLVLSAPWAG